MVYERPKTFKVTGGIPYEVNDEMNRLASAAGMGKNQFVSLCVILGLGQWKRIYEPEKLLDSETWDKIMKNYEGKIPDAKVR